jgi:hypothetical protein
LLPTTVVISFEDDAADQTRGSSIVPPRSALGDIKTAATPDNVAVQTRVAAQHLGAMLANRSRFSAPVEVQTFEAALADQLVAACRNRAVGPAKTTLTVQGSVAAARVREPESSLSQSTDDDVQVLDGVSLYAAEARFVDIVRRYPLTPAATDVVSADWATVKRSLGGEWGLARNLGPRLSAGTRGARFAATSASLVAVDSLYAGARLGVTDFLHEDAAVFLGHVTGGGAGNETSYAVLTVALRLAGLVGSLVTFGVTVGALTAAPVRLVSENESVLALTLALDHVLLLLGVRLAWCASLAAFLCVYLRAPLREWEHRQLMVRPRLTRRQLEHAIAETLRVAAPRRVPADWIAQEAQRLRPSDSLAPDMQSPPGHIVLVRGHYTASTLVNAYRKLATTERRAERLCVIRVVGGAAKRAAAAGVTGTLAAIAPTTSATVAPTTTVAATALPGIESSGVSQATAILSTTVPVPVSAAVTATATATAIPNKTSAGNVVYEDVSAIWTWVTAAFATADTTPAAATATIESAVDTEAPRDDVDRRENKEEGKVAATSESSSTVTPVSVAEVVAVDPRRLLQLVMGASEARAPAVTATVGYEFAFDGDLLRFLFAAAERLREPMALAPISCA